MTLDQLVPGQAAIVAHVGGSGTFRRRLLELGLLPGTEIVRTGQAPFGDPLSFRVRGAVVCLRRAEAGTIGVRASLDARPEPAPVPVAALGSELRS